MKFYAEIDLVAYKTDKLNRHNDTFSYNLPRFLFNHVKLHM